MVCLSMRQPDPGALTHRMSRIKTWRQGETLDITVNYSVFDEENTAHPEFVCDHVDW